MNALEELAKWDRKYYSYTISTGRHIQPGDGLTVTLCGGGRKVSVGDYELDDWDNDTFATIGEVILEAIRRWHADDSNKYYRALFYTNAEIDISQHNQEMCRKWSDRSIEVRVQAKNEAEAVAKEKECCGLDVEPSIWEVHADWNH